jgi:hypothetical protein
MHLRALGLASGFVTVNMDYSTTDGVCLIPDEVPDSPPSRPPSRAFWSPAEHLPATHGLSPSRLGVGVFVSLTNSSCSTWSMPPDSFGSLIVGPQPPVWSYAVIPECIL